MELGTRVDTKLNFRIFFFWQLLYLFTFVAELYLFRLLTESPGCFPVCPLPDQSSAQILCFSVRFVISECSSKGTRASTVGLTTLGCPLSRVLALQFLFSLLYLWYLEICMFYLVFLSLLNWRISLKQTNLPVKNMLS